jgi:carbon-monoxide dehydrogenase iron sulfur subunit
MRRVYVKDEVCIGCGLCEVYCRVEHSQSKDLVKAFKKETACALPRTRVERNMEISFPIQCRHCAEPWCVYSCITGAMHKEPTNGKVSVDMQKCIGCWTCIVACPFGAIRRNLTSKTVIKCDLCPGREIPACVVNCPNEALMLGADEKKE